MEPSPSIYESKEYKRSRSAYLWECAFEYFTAILVTDAFLAKLLSHMGLSDALIGIISTFVTLACVFQLFAMLAVQRIVNTKRYVVFFHMLGRILFSALFLTPLLPISAEYKGVLVAGCVLIAYFGHHMAYSVLFRWGNSFVDPHHRAAFSAKKEIVSLTIGTVITLSMGYMLDIFEANNDLQTGFIFCAVAIFIFSFCDFICLMTIKNDKKPKQERQIVPMKEVLRNTLGVKGFRYMFIVSTVYNAAVYITVGFLGTYRINPDELAFSVGTVQIINILGLVARLLLTRPFGKFADRTSFAKGVKFGMVLSAIGFASVIFTVPETRYLIILYTILYNASLAGTGQNFLNSTYSYVDSKYFVQATAIKSVVGGLCGFLISLVSGAVLEAIQANGNMIFGIPVYGQQVLAISSTLGIVACILMLHFVVEKQKVLVQ